MKKLGAMGLMALCGSAVVANAAPTNEEMWKIIQQQQAEIERLKTEQKETKEDVKEAEQKIEATADAVDSAGGSLPKSLEWATNTKIGGYGELHYNNFETSDDQVDAHRFVVFIGHEFDDNVRFFSELELEHSLAGDDKPGEVELEQAYVEWDYAKGQSLVSGLFLVPVGILNETHEPETFYGVERNLVEKNIIPTTWWETGVMFRGEIAPGLSYDVALHGGLGTEGANIRSGRQKSAKQTANDLAYTARIKYTGVPGLELAATLQLQEDISQGANNVAGDDDASATLFQTHVVYEKSIFAVRALYAAWDVDGDIAATAGRDKQEGWYIEPSIKAMEDLGFFIRYSEWDNTAGLSDSEANEVIDYGVNYWLTPEVVFKLDFQDASDYNENDSLNIGLGWSF
ncbi:MAG: DUF4200 domain-containing protein [Agarilytica sp.]